MLTPQEINEKGFNKAVFNGYDMGDVDDFLETVSNDYNALYKENAILKGKLKVLVEKVEEYRSTEDAMRMALLTAQRMGEEITTEATRAKDEMLMKTEMEIKEKLSDTEKRVEDEELRLAIAEKETAKFIELSQAIISKHSEFLEKLEAARRAVKPKGAPKQGAAPRVAPVKAAPPVKPAQPVRPEQPIQQPIQQAQQGQLDQSTRPFPQAPVEDAEIDDIAMQISSVVEQISDAEIATPAPAYEEAHTHAAEEPPQSLFDDDDDSVKLYNANEDHVDISPRPKFDFDDLKFGANFDSDD